MGRKGPAFQTNVENVWSAGDAPRSATVVEGIADARCLCRGCHRCSAHLRDPRAGPIPPRPTPSPRKCSSTWPAAPAAETTAASTAIRSAKTADSCPNPRQRRREAGRWPADRPRRQDVQRVRQLHASSARTPQACHDKFTLFQTARTWTRVRTRRAVPRRRCDPRPPGHRPRTLDLSQPNDLPRDIRDPHPHPPQQVQLPLYRDGSHPQRPSRPGRAYCAGWLMPSPTREGGTAGRDGWWTDLRLRGCPHLIGRLRRQLPSWGSHWNAFTRPPLPGEVARRSRDGEGRRKYAATSPVTFGISILPFCPFRDISP